MIELTQLENSFLHKPRVTRKYQIYAVVFFPHQIRSSKHQIRIKINYIYIVHLIAYMIELTQVENSF